MNRGYEGFKREILNVPNMITIGRLFLIPPVIWLLDPTDPLRNLIACLIFATASGLDILDGYLARRQGLVTVFGKFVDPLADKLMAMAAMIYLANIGLLPPWIVVVTLGRDLYINGLRQVAAERGVVIAAGQGGKLKTVFQLVGLCCVMVRYTYQMPIIDESFDFYWTGMVFIYLSVALAVFSAMQYTQGFRRGLREQGPQE